MKSKILGLFILVLFIIFGTLVGIQIDSDTYLSQGDLNYPINRDFEIKEINELTEANSNIEKRIDELSKQVEEYEKERAIESIPLSSLRNQVNKYKLLAGYTPVKGSGVTIVLDGNLQENIADIVEGKRYLINLVNELRAFGGEAISINEFRITARSEIVLAGNHIIINGTYIAPPYVIKAIGDTYSLERYVEHRTLIFENMLADGIKSSVEFSDNIEILGIVREKPMQFLEVMEE
ncbi:DUF881 domain-containing protein [Alkaliphilus pronyensis]|uniref:DUF881 domain-containing protein n=1 Tax=Alkaliphilus pronyensis TaxID=1482732 RepID=A0A6I0FBJ7_9FIRM|nr:DUF881 domain-containing protein [Alkaliphilus pronyensis]KAB3537712.1 DUF881 domain-containing protein [Alkaliphilus pronyensis]